MVNYGYKPVLNAVRQSFYRRGVSTPLPTRLQHLKRALPTLQDEHVAKTLIHEAAHSMPDTSHFLETHYRGDSYTAIDAFKNFHADLAPWFNVAGPDERRVEDAAHALTFGGIACFADTRPYFRILSHIIGTHIATTTPIRDLSGKTIGFHETGWTPHTLHGHDSGHFGRINGLLLAQVATSLPFTMAMVAHLGLKRLGLTLTTGTVADLRQLLLDTGMDTRDMQAEDHKHKLLEQVQYGVEVVQTEPNTIPQCRGPRDVMDAVSTLIEKELQRPEIRLSPSQKQLDSSANVFPLWHALTLETIKNQTSLSFLLYQALELHQFTINGAPLVDQSFTIAATLQLLRDIGFDRRQAPLATPTELLAQRDQIQLKHADTLALAHVDGPRDLLIAMVEAMEAEMTTLDYRRSRIRRP